MSETLELTVRRFPGVEYMRLGRLSMLSVLGVVVYRRVGSMRSFRWERRIGGGRATP
jgi:hypothetical protein